MLHQQQVETEQDWSVQYIRFFHVKSTLLKGRCSRTFQYMRKNGLYEPLYSSARAVKCSDCELGWLKTWISRSLMYSGTQLTINLHQMRRTSNLILSLTRSQCRHTSRQAKMLASWPWSQQHSWGQTEADETETSASCKNFIIIVQADDEEKMNKGHISIIRQTM